MVNRPIHIFNHRYSIKREKFELLKSFHHPEYLINVEVFKVNQVAGNFTKSINSNKYWQSVNRSQITDIWKWLISYGIKITKKTLIKWYKIYNIRIAGEQYADISKSLGTTKATVVTYYFRCKSILECFHNNEPKPLLKWMKWWGHYLKNR